MLTIKICLRMSVDTAIFINWNVYTSLWTRMSLSVGWFGYGLNDSRFCGRSETFLSLFKTLIPPLGPIQPLVQGIRCLWPGREDGHSPTSGPEMNERSYTPISLICLYRGHSDVFTVMRRLTTWIRSEKRVVRRFCRCANVMECTYTNFEIWHKLWNLALTWPPYGWKSFQASVSTIVRSHPYWRFALVSNFSPQSAYLEFPKILITVVYAARRWPKSRYAAHDCT